MRKHKFRAWDKWDEKMLYDVQDTYDYMRNEVMEECFGDVLKSERYIVMECTGYEDKNKKEIYEGDVLKDKGVVEYGKHTIGCCGCCYTSHDVIGFYFSNYNPDEYTFENLEVIGNIYENPELLENDDNEN